MGRPAAVHAREHLAAHLWWATMVHFLAHTSRFRWQSLLVMHLLLLLGCFSLFLSSLLPLSFFSAPAGEGDDDGEEDPAPSPLVLLLMLATWTWAGNAASASAADAATRRMRSSSVAASASKRREQAMAAE